MSRKLNNANSGTSITATINNGTCVYCDAGTADLKRNGVTKVSLSAGEEHSLYFGNGARMELEATSAGTTAGFQG